LDGTGWWSAKKFALQLWPGRLQFDRQAGRELKLKILSAQIVD
jgi:hypothetical protein